MLRLLRYRRPLVVETAGSIRHFETPNRTKLWYPKHMTIQLKVMEAKLKSVELIIEVHDARVPITGRNPQFLHSLYAIRPHILVFNKVDLIDIDRYRKSETTRWLVFSAPVEQYYEQRGVKNVVWTDCKRRSRRAIEELHARILNLICNTHRFNRIASTEYKIMVVGIPNVGKSALVNSLRMINLPGRQEAVQEGARPGMTVRVQNRVRIADKPPIYMLDTPGVLHPYANDDRDTMKLALCNLIAETATDPIAIANFYLQWMNENHRTDYVEQFGLDAPTTDIERVLVKICENSNLRNTVHMPGSGNVIRWNFDSAAKKMIAIYRSSKCQFLDVDKL